MISACVCKSWSPSSKLPMPFSVKWPLSSIIIEDRIEAGQKILQGSEYRAMVSRKTGRAWKDKGDRWHVKLFEAFKLAFDPSRFQNFSQEPLPDKISKTAAQLHHCLISDQRIFLSVDEISLNCNASNVYIRSQQLSKSGGQGHMNVL